MANLEQVFTIFPRLKFDLAVNYVKVNLGSSFEQFLFTSPMLHTKANGHWPFGFKEYVWRDLTLYGHVSHFGHVTWIIYKLFNTFYFSLSDIFCENMIKFIDCNPD